MRALKYPTLLASLLVMASGAFAAETIDMPDPYDDIIVDLLEEGSVSREDGLAAFERIYEVASHPRCANCHVGEDNIPMWSGPSYGKTRVHGMNIDGGESRIGVETLVCSACHTTSTNFNSEPNAPPRFGIAWQLAPVEFEWFGKTPEFICAQLKDPEQNGGRDWVGLVDHLTHDAEISGPVLWGWDPGQGREPAPRTLQDHVNDMIAWGAAGQPCPDDDLTSNASEETNNG